MVASSLTGCNVISDIIEQYKESQTEEDPLEKYKDYSDVRGDYSCDYIFKNKALEFMNHLENNDLDGLKRMFTKELLMKEKDADEKIRQIFELYDGGVVSTSIDIKPGYSETGGNIKEGGEAFYIETEEETYLCVLGFKYQDGETKDVGLQSLSFGTIGMPAEEVYGYDDVGIKVSDASSEGYVRILNRVFPTNENYDEITLEAAKGIKTRDFKEIKKELGEPIFASVREIFYKIKGTEKRYLRFYLDDGEDGNIDQILSAKILSSNEILETLLE